ncbi:sporulation-specific protein 15-like [Scyliorhinus canicula]|uniref:sporulation-specific protein 15-like n=1 Tax=Scyliorhinus canicula TaxID=7830 RepID=UPI0018F6E6F3|nr:sporulation-specific protein 15-like [Scyliorhinus canicula]
MGEVHMNVHIRDAFVSGIRSTYIRQPLLENGAKDLQDTVTLATSLEVARHNLSMNPVDPASPPQTSPDSATLQACAARQPAQTGGTPSYFCGQVEGPASLEELLQVRVVVVLIMAADGDIVQVQMAAACLNEKLKHEKVKEFKDYLMEQVLHFVLPEFVRYHGNLSTNWRAFKQRFQLYTEASNPHGVVDAGKIALLLTIVGEHAAKIFRSFKYSKAQDTTQFQTVLDKFESYYEVNTKEVVNVFDYFNIFSMKITQDAAVGEAKQLVAFGKDGTMMVNEDVLGSCFLQDDVKELPVCLISIIGEERKGKSFLLNYLLRRLSNLDCGDQEWMGGTDEKLCGFEWRPGSNATTKGVFIWSTPFLIKTQQGQMAVFLVDTEGCDGVGQDKGISVQLSALSMLLSSYLIFNISSKINQTDLEFLEIFLDVAQKVGEVLNLDPIQHLDILVRDWYADTHGKEAGMKYLDEVLKKLKNSKTQDQPFIEKQLSTSQCFLLPHPGKTIACTSTGRLMDMADDFRQYLVDYINCTFQDLPTSGRKDLSGSILTSTQLFQRIKLFSKTIEKCSVMTKTPLQMSNAIWNMKQREDKRRTFQNYIKKQGGDTEDYLERLKTSPHSMQTRLEGKVKVLMDDFQKHLRGSEENTTDVNELDELLKNELETFCNAYRQMFQVAIDELKKETLEEFKSYSKQQVGETQDYLERLKTSPHSMQTRLEGKVKVLKDDFQKHLRGSEENTTDINKLDELLKNELEAFCNAYRQMFQEVIDKLKMEKLEEFKSYSKQQGGETQDYLKRLKTSPHSMQTRLERKVKDLMDDFQKYLRGSEENTTDVNELDELLKNELETFCNAYRQMFQAVIDKLKMEKLEKFKSYSKQQGGDTEDYLERLKTSPHSMQTRLEGKVKDLMDDFQKHLRGSEENTTDVNELDELLKNELETFCNAYRQMFQVAIDKLKMEKLEEFKSYSKQQGGETQDYLERLKTSPHSMQIRLEGKVKDLMDDFQKHLRGSEENTTDINELDGLLKNELETFCNAYRQMFQAVIDKLKMEKLEKFKSYCKQQGGETQDYLERLKTSPHSMQTRLEGKVKDLMDDFQKHLRGSEENTTDVNELAELLKNELETFCNAYRQMFQVTIDKLKMEKLEEFKSYCKQQGGETQDYLERLKTSPHSMQTRLEGKVKDLMDDFQKHLRGSEENTTDVNELAELLKNELETFCNAYRQMFQVTIDKLKMEKLEEFKSYSKQQGGETQDYLERLKTSPHSMQTRLEGKVKDLMNDFQKHLRGSEENTTDVNMLAELLKNELETFCNAYRQMFQVTIDKLKMEKLEEFKSYSKQQYIQ